MNNTYEFGMSQFTTMPWSFEEDIERYPDLGVEAIEVCEIKLNPERQAEQLAVLAASPLRVSSVQPVVRTLFPSASQPEPMDIENRMARFRQSIDGLSGASVGVPFITNTGVAPAGNDQLVFDTAVEAYRSLAEYAREGGVLMALEPLNPTIMNVESSIWTIEQAMEIIEAVDRANFGLCLDYWNIWQNPRVEDSIIACGDRIFIVQVSDWRMPRSHQDRLIPGEGDIPLTELIRATRDAGYTGAYEVEIFSDGFEGSLWAGDLADVVRQSKAGMDNAWNK